MVPRFPHLAALLLGFASATGFAPLEWWPATIVSLALLMALLLGQTRLRAVLTIGWVFGWAHFALGLNWIQKSFTYQDAMPHWLGYLAPSLLAMYLAVFPAAAAGLAWRWCRGNDRAFVVLFAAAWVVVELLRAVLFSGFPWNPLGATLLPLIELARASRWVGTYGLGALVILAGGAMLLAFRNERRSAAVILGALIGLFVAGAMAERPGSRAESRILIVQPDIEQNLVQDMNRRAEVLATYARLSRRRAGTAPTLVLWPEGALRYLIEPGYPRAVYLPGEPYGVLAVLGGLLGPRDMLVTGADSLIYEDGRTTGAHNAMFAIDARGRIRARYDKAHLVPWGEYLPARPILEPLGLSRVVPGAIDFIPGPGPRTLPLPAPFGELGLQICYEIVFSGEVVDPTRRPAMLFNPSNDSWFGTWGPPQHLAQARLRAIEEGLPVLRSTPTGISALIAADGRIVAALPSGRQGVIEADTPAPLRPTLFSRFGNALAWALAALLALIGVALARRAR